MTTALSSSLPPASVRPVPSGFDSSDDVAGPGAGLAEHAVGMDDALHGEPEDRLRVADRVAAGDRAAGLGDDGRGGVEDGRHRPAGEVLGEGGDVDRQHDPPAHGEHVAAGVGRGDGAVVGRIVDQRREEVGRRHERRRARRSGRSPRRRTAPTRRATTGRPTAGRSRTRSASTDAPHLAAHPPHDVHSVSRSERLGRVTVDVIGGQVRTVTAAERSASVDGAPEGLAARPRTSATSGRRPAPSARPARRRPPRGRPAARRASARRTTPSSPARRPGRGPRGRRPATPTGMPSGNSAAPRSRRRSIAATSRIPSARRAARRRRGGRR